MVLGRSKKQGQSNFERSLQNRCEKVQGLWNRLESKRNWSIKSEQKEEKEKQKREIINNLRPWEDLIKKRGAF